MAGAEERGSEEGGASDRGASLYSFTGNPNPSFGGAKMRSLKNRPRAVISSRWAGFFLFVCLPAVTLALPARAAGQEAGQQTFTSPAEAVEAMITAAKAHDTDALLHIFGSNSKEAGWRRPSEVCDYRAFRQGGPWPEATHHREN